MHGPHAVPLIPSHASEHAPTKSVTAPTQPWGFMPNNKRIFINIVGTVAALLSSITLIPQLAEVIGTRNVAGLSVGTYSIIIATSGLWQAYHMMTRTYHGLFSATFNMVIAITIYTYIVGIRYLGWEGTDTR